jgi:antitoxin HicB
MNSKDKKLREYMKLPYTVMLKRDEEGDIVARIKELEGCVAHGEDEMDALGQLHVVKEMWFEAALEADQAIPQPEEEGDLPSGKFLTRIPRTLHKSLIEKAAFEGVSLNQLVLTALAEFSGREEKESTLKLDYVVASALSQRNEGGYGSAQGVGKLRLVMPGKSKGELYSTHTLEDILSISSSQLPQRREG